MKRIAVLTSGGDCSGMNAAIRAVVRTAMARGIEVVGIQKGYRGLIDRQYEVLGTRSVSNTLQRGGTFLQSARCKEMMTEAGQAVAVSTLSGLGVEGLVVIGGDGSLRGARVLDQKGIPTIGIAASIDNDIAGTDMSLGVDTALNNIVYAVNCLKDTASSHDRAFVVETMGRTSGALALHAGIAGGADLVLIPEIPFDYEEAGRTTVEGHRRGKLHTIVVVAEGVASGDEVARRLGQYIPGMDIRVSVLGHIQRGGTPTGLDRVVASQFGAKAVDLLLDGMSDVMVARQGMSLTSVSLSYACKHKPALIPVLYQLC